MTGQIGQYALILALVVALTQVLMSLASRLAIVKTPPGFGRAGAILQLVFISAAVLALLVLPPTGPAMGKAAWLVWTLLTLMTVLAAVVMTASLTRWSAPASPEEAPRPPSERAVLITALGLATVMVIAGSGLVALLERGPAAQPSESVGSAARPVAHSEQTPEIMAMVEGLDARLKASPDDPEGWEMLMRSRVNLGQMDKASAAYRDALAAYGGNAEQQAKFRQAARALGISG